ncbi:MAG TPA: ABC transporter ATP-binding protein [Casimicrobiaceae bacterium]|nr:ABC transporter ATP-binding protein [Casimicrobiaceae bacterium]
MINLRVSGLGKAYKRYTRKSGRLREWFGLGSQHALTWVLRDISFEVGAGEAVALVGANGAGKSTLLKIIAGTLTPTLGFYQLAGRVSAILELGTGFDPNFTGRQNVAMAGHLLGISVEDMRSLMHEIEDFAEIGDSIDQPLRTYSTGMHVRLAFSVATAVRPDILIVDEALSVGDTYFQHKSFDRIRRYRDAGTALLFVSHSAAVVKTLCDRAILLDEGLMVRDDSPDVVLDYYNAMLAKQHADYEIHQSNIASRGSTTRSGTAAASIVDIDLEAEGRFVLALRSGSSAALTIVFEVKTPLPQLTVGILIRDKLGNDVFGTNTYHLGVHSSELAAGSRHAVKFMFPRMELGVGSYSVTAALHAEDAHTAANFDWWDRALVFQVLPSDAPLSIGVAALAVSADWVNHSDAQRARGTAGARAEVR